MDSKQKPTIIYDGQCQFCSGQIDKIKRLAPEDSYNYLPRQLPNLLDKFPQLSGEDFNTGLRLINNKGRVSVGADAVYEIYKTLTPYKYIAWIYQLPACKQLCKGVYRLIAKNRNRLKGKCDSHCES
jgi:predicted DCC family thiol-disulfide oxidoreductase YuxK